MNSKLDLPLVSVCMVTYNHAQFIKEAIEGVMTQQTSFIFELIIGNDASTDNTNKLIEEYVGKEYERKYIKYFNHLNNLGMIPNFIFAFKQCKGKYFAFCDGDDFWTDPYKLQKQVDFLEANPEYAICFHSVNELTDEKEPVLSDLNSSLKEETYTIEDLAKRNIIHTPSVVFRNKLFEQFPVWFKDSPAGDYPLYMLNAQYGKIKYFPEPMAVYRRHSNSIWSSKSYLEICTNWITTLEFLITEFKGEVKNILMNQLIDTHKTILKLLRDDPEKQELYIQKLEKFSDILYNFNKTYKEEKLIEFNKIKYSREYKLGTKLLKPARFLHGLFKKK